MARTAGRAAAPSRAPRADGGPRAAHVRAATRYVEAAFYLEHEGEEVRPGRLAEWLGVRAPTVSEALRRLEQDGLITVTPTHRVRLTEAGHALAAATVRRHRILEVWLTDVLGLDWVAADREAHRLSEAVSDEVLDRLQASLGNPLTCPHGNAIPGMAVPETALRALADLDSGQRARVARISELAEHDAPHVLAFLFEVGLVPGRLVEVESTPAAAGILAVRVAGAQPQALSLDVARVVWVEELAPGVEAA